MKLLLAVVLLGALLGLTSCGAAPPSTAIVCSTNTSTSSSTTSTSTCTDPVTGISVTISPATVSVGVVSAQQFAAFISGGTNSIAIWEVNNVQGGSDSLGRIDSNGLYHAPSTVPSPATVTVTAISFEDQKVSASSTVTITPAPTVAITSPTGPLTVTAGSVNTVNFSATETGGSSNTILWYAGPVGGLGILGGNATFGTISAAGVYSPPLTPPIGQNVTVTAAAEDALTSTATLNVKVVGYSTSSFQGRFAFSLAGTNAAGHFVRAGSFTADGAGNLGAVLEDVTSSAGATSAPITAIGTYTVGSDGRGTIQLNDGLTPAVFDFVLVNGTQMQITGADATGTAVGQASGQDASVFNSAPLGALNGTYVFDFAGIHGANSVSQIGEFTADGAGNITNGSVDINDGGALTQLQIAGSRTVCTPAPTALSTYTLATSGRGTATLNTLTSTCAPGPTLTLNFYVATRGSAKFVGTDTAAQVAGFTSQQAPNASFSAASLSGNFAFLLGGSGAGGPIATGGSFTADGNGHLTAGVLDENVNGTPATNVAFVASGGVAGTYAVASNGRGTMAFTTAGRAYSLVFYVGPVGTNTTAVLQETDSAISSRGNFTLQQTGAFALTSLQGNYAVSTSGTAGAALQTRSGQLAADGAGNVAAGSIDINTGGVLTPGQAVTGTYSAPTAAGRSALALNAGALNFAAYIVNSSQVYLVDIQPGQLAAGALLRQF